MVTAVQDTTDLLRLRSEIQGNVVRDINEFMGKPRVTATTVWAPAAAVGSLLLSGNSWTSTSNDPVFASKIFGFSGISYTTHVKVQVNSTPFQQGRLRLSYYPNAVASPLKAASHLAHRTSISQLPGLEMNVNDTSMEIVVPFTSFEEYIDVTGNVSDPLTWYLHVFSPLFNGPNAVNTSANITVWTWFTDVKLYGASAAVIVPQSGARKGKIRTRNVSEQEERPLSGWLSGASKFAGSLSSIPSISGITGPTSIFLSGLSGMASYFGYSRPVNGEPVRPMAPHYHSALPNSDGVSPASVLALRHDAKVKGIVDFSPSSFDEMSVNFVKRQWAYFDEFTWTNSNVAGSLLYKRDLSTGYDSTVGVGVAHAMAPLTMLGYLFRLYRGGIEVMFKFSKTGFHSGSLAVSCQYGTASGSGAYLLTDTDPLHRSIVDIQEGTEFCLIFPFVSGAEYLETFQFFGTWYVHVLNALISPETVSPRVTVQMYVRGAEDMEFAVPCNTNTIGPIVLQGGVVEDDDEITCEVIGGVMAPQKVSGLQTMVAMSDSCASLLQVLKTGMQTWIGANAAPTTAIPITFCPSGIGAWRKIGAAPSVMPIIQIPALDLIRSCYAYTRGGFEVSLVAYDAETASVVPRQSWVARSGISFGNPGPVSYATLDFPGYYVPTAAKSLQPITGHLAANATTHGLGVILPYRCRYRASPTLYLPSSDTLNDTQSLNFVTTRVSPNDIIVTRVADDFQCMYWVGVPLLAVATP